VAGELLTFLLTLKRYYSHFPSLATESKKPLQGLICKGLLGNAGHLKY